MKRIFLYIVVLICIPFFVVNFINIKELEPIEINLKYLSNILVRVKREDGSIEKVFLEEYVTGVVAGEMPASFELEALKAQSVASRTYVLKKILNNSNTDYDIVDTVINQVYLDEEQLKKKWGNKYTEYINKIRTAVNETSMEYLEYNNEIVDALFFSTSNGYTEDSGVFFSSNLPYLKSVESFWDEEVASTFNSSTSMSLQEFYEKLNINYNSKLEVEILEKSDSNRIVKLKINGREFLGKDIYNKLKLKSCDFVLKQVGNNVVVDTKGYGHGVGMSQYGAHGMAKSGYDYKKILTHYYTGTQIVKYEK